MKRHYRGSLGKEIFVFFYIIIFHRKLALLSFHINSTTFPSQSSVIDIDAHPREHQEILI